MTTRNISEREGYKTGPLRFGKEDLRSGKIDEVREKVKREEVKRNPLLDSGPTSPPSMISAPEPQRLIGKPLETTEKIRTQQHVDDVTQLANKLSDNRDEIKDLRKQLDEAQSDYDASELQSLREDLEDLQSDLGGRDEEILLLKSEIQELEDERNVPPVPRAIRILNVKSIKMVGSTENREDEFRILVDVSAPNISTTETQLRVPISQLKAIQKATNKTI